MSKIESQLKSIWTRIPATCRISFFSVFFGGLLIHLYIFTNNQLLNHDSLYNFYTKQDMFRSGRPFLTYACAPTSYLDLHWVNGLFSLVYLGLSSAILSCIFEIKSKLICIISSLFIASYPITASIFSYMYTADGYYLAMLSTLLGVYLMIRYENGVKGLVLSIPFFVYGMGIYQAFFSVALVTILLWYLYRILTGNFCHGKQLLLHVLKSAVTVLLSVVLYYLIFQAFLSLRHATLTDYQSMDSFGLAFRNLYELGSLIKKCGIEAVNFFTSSSQGISVYFFSYVVYISVLLLIIAFFLKNKVYRHWLDVLLILLIGILLPCAIYIYYFISNQIYYHMLMKMSVVVLLLFPLILADKLRQEKRSTLILCIVLLISYIGLIGHYTIDDNIAYLALNQSYEKSYSLATRIAGRIEALDEITPDYQMKLAVIGQLDNQPFHEPGVDQSIPPMTGVESGLVYFEPYHYVAFLNQYLGFNCILASEEEVTEIKESAAYQAMSSWPATDSVSKINDIVVIRLE